MATVADTAINIVKRYVRNLRESGIDVQEAVLYGSYAKGKAHEWSDIDVAIISKDFQGNRFEDRMKICRPTLDIDCRLDPLTYRPEDFCEEEDPFVEEILKTGIRIR